MGNSVKRFLALVLALVMVFGMMPQIVIGASAATFGGGEQLYLKPNSNWKNDNARFAIYVFNNSTNQDAWADMFDSDNDGIYEVTVPTDSWTNVIFCRMNPSATANNWNNKWNQTGDLEYDGTNNLCTINDGQWDCGTNVTWSVYTPSDVPVVHTYTVAGDSALCGTEWDVANTANDMTDEDADGIYTKVYENVAAGAYEYKVAVDHSWNESYGNGTANATVTVAKGGSTVTITFNAETKAVNAEVEVPHEHSYLYDCSTECSTCTNGHREASHAFVAGVCTYGCGTADPDYVAPVTNVAQIGEQGYETLTEAIAAATAGDTIILLADITEDVTVSKNLTIDGAGKTYTGKMNLTASTTIKNVNFDGKGYNGYAVETRSAAKVVIEDCTAKSYGYGFLQVVSNNDTVTVKNVTVSGCNYGVKVDRSNGVTLENVKLDCAVAGLLNSNYSSKTITIKNSEISILGTWTRNDTTKTTYIFEGENTVKTFDINAELDTFKLADVNSTLTAPNEITVTTDVADHEVVYEEGTYKVAPVPKVAQIGETQYKTLTEAIAAATAGDTITLLADVTEDVTVDKNLTIDGAGKTYTGGISVTAGKFTVKNVNFVGGTANYAVTTNRITSVTVENCTVKGYNYGFLYANKSTPTVVVKNVTVEDCNYGVHYVYGSNATLENVTMTNVETGLYVQNYAAKTITVKNCTLGAIDVWVRDGYSAVQTFKFEGTNTATTLDSECAKYVLTAVDATLTAPEGATVTTTVADHEVVYEEGTYKVAPVPKVAQIGETQYKTLTEAIAAADVGDTITLLADITETVKIEKDLTIDGANFQYTGLIEVTGSKVDAVIKNVNFVDGSQYAVKTNTISSITIEDCTVKGYTYGMLYANKSTSTIVVKNVTVEGGEYGLAWNYGSKATLENVTVTGTKYGVITRNYGAKTITLKNCSIDAEYGILVDAKGSKTDTFKFEGANTVSSLGDSQYAKYVLTAVDATLKAPKVNDDDVITDLEGYKAVHKDGIWSVQEEKELFNIQTSSIVLGNELAMYFFVNKSDLEGEDYIAVVTKTYADGRDDVVVEIPYAKWEDRTDGRMRFKFNGIAAKEMGDDIIVFIKDSEGNVLSTTYTDSIQKYVERGFEAGKATGELATMLVDMLNYGAAAQGMFHYNEEHLANANMAAYQNRATQTVNLNNKQEKGTGYKTMSAVLESNISLIMFFDKSYVNQSMTAVVTFTDHYGKAHTLEIDGSEFEDRGDKGWAITINELVVADGCQLITCKFLDAEGKEVNGVYGIDSLESMCARAVAGGGGSWYEDIMKFSIAAYNYFH